MKIKNDFVTNSSSTAYVVMIPENFTISRAEAIRMYDACDFNVDNEDKLADTVAYREIEEGIETLKRGEEIYPEISYGNMSTPIWRTITDMCDNHNLILTTIDLSSDEFKTIGITQKDLMNTVINSVDLTQIVNTLIEGANNVNEKKK